jgi:hypothetical protein
MANIIWLWKLPPIKADREGSVETFFKNFNKEVLINGSSNSFLENFDGFAKSRQNTTTNKLNSSLFTPLNLLILSQVKSIKP